MNEAWPISQKDFKTDYIYPDEKPGGMARAVISVGVGAGLLRGWFGFDTVLTVWTPYQARVKPVNSTTQIRT